LDALTGKRGVFSLKAFTIFSGSSHLSKPFEDQGEWTTIRQVNKLFGILVTRGHFKQPVGAHPTPRRKSLQIR
jgi:hypothetical protein